MKVGPTHYHRTIHLKEEELLAMQQECPWCKSVNRRSIAVLQSSPHVRLMLCSDCQASSASRMPTAKALDAYYGNYYQPPEETYAPEKSRVTMGDEKRMGNHLAESFGSTGERKMLNILDFGGGDGVLSVLAAERLLESNSSLQGVNITVVDYNTQIHEPVNANINIQGATKLDELGDSTYDFVIASAILVHIPDCAHILESLLDRVSSEGVFYLRTPYIAPFMKLAQSLGKFWDFTYPAHVHDLGQAFWEGYFSKKNKHGFEVKHSRPSIVQASIRANPVEAIASYMFKFPWYLLGKSWGFVGGWEITVTRR